MRVLNVARNNRARRHVEHWRCSVLAALSLPPASDKTLTLYLAAAESESLKIPRFLLWESCMRHTADQRRTVVATIADRTLRYASATDESESHRRTACAGKSGWTAPPGIPRIKDIPLS